MEYIEQQHAGIKRRLEKLIEDRKSLVGYLVVKVNSQDLKAVTDAANDLRVLDKEFETLTNVSYMLEQRPKVEEVTEEQFEKMIEDAK